MMRDEERKILEECLKEALAFSDHCGLLLTGIRIAEAIDTLAIETRQDRQGA